MKQIGKTMKISVLATVSALVLFGGASVSTASADNTPSPIPTVYPAPSTDPLDAEVNDETDVLALIGDNQDEQDILDTQVNADINGGDVQAENADVQENDTGVDGIDAENQQGNDSFNQDITQAEQSGNHDDAVELGVASSIVTSVTVPEAAAMAADDTEAHAILTGVPQK